MPAVRLGDPRACGDPFADERGLHFGHGANDGEHRAAHRSVGVDLVLDADEPDPKVVARASSR